MTKVSIIGAGPAGCILAYALLAKNFDVTLYSDRTPDQWLNHSAPTGTAYLYDEVIDIERDLGMDYWSQDMFGGGGVLLDFSPVVGFPEPIVAKGHFEYGREGSGIDQRMRVHRWLSDLEGRGGKLVIGSVTPEQLDQIALKSDLTVLAAGKAELSRIIPRDAERSVYDKPQRKLAMAMLRSKSGQHVRNWFTDRIPYAPVKFDFFGDAGEYFWVPYTHKTYGATYCILFEAKEGSTLDRFDDCKSGEDVVEQARNIIRDISPWEHHIVDDMEYVTGDPYAWLKGKFSPTVRQAFGRLPSGGLVMPIGDTAVTFDPIGGQGGNFANRSAKFVADAVIAKGDGPFDETWMSKVNADLWDQHGKAAYTFNNLLLEPLTEAGQTVLMTAVTDEQAGHDFFNGFPHPKKLFPMMEDVEAAREFAASYATKAA